MDRVTTRLERLLSQRSATMPVDRRDLRDTEGGAMSDFFDEPGVGMGGTADVPSRSGVHCDACNEWMDADDANCPNCGSER